MLMTFTPEPPSIMHPGRLLGTRPSMRKITQHCVVKKNLRIGEAKQNTHTERERGTKNMYIHKMATVTNSITTTTTFTKGYKVTLYSD